MHSGSAPCFASIIVPVYNAETWLPECINSVLAQSDLDFELILVNDGSRDRSGTILDAYMQAHPQHIRVIHQPNRGVSSARNAGLDVARGEFVLYLDADDLLHPQLIELLKTADSTQHADCYVWSYLEFSSAAQFQSVAPLALSFYNKEALLPRVFRADGDLLGFVGNKAFRRALIQSIRFDEDVRVQEDLLYICRCLTDGGTQRFCDLRFPLYGYRQHAQSTMHQSFNANQFTLLHAQDRIIRLLQNGSAAEQEISAYLAQGFARYAAVTNKKLLHTRIPNRTDAFRMLDTYWSAYAQYAVPAQWPLKERCYYYLQALCHRIRCAHRK